MCVPQILIQDLADPTITWLEFADAWIMSGVLLSTSMNIEHGQHDTWADAVIARGDRWIFGDNSTLRSHNEFTAFYHFFRECTLTTATALRCDLVMSPHSHILKRLHETVRTFDFGTREQRLFDDLFFEWAKFLQNKSYSVSYTPHLGLGINSEVAITAGTSFFIAAKKMAFIGLRAWMPVPCGHRWSTTQNHYIGGPISLLNHACKRHSNIDYDLEDDGIISLVHINVGDQFFWEYADEGYLNATRGLRCGHDEHG